MKTIRLIIYGLLCLAAPGVAGQGYPQEFRTLLEKGDTAAQRRLLQKWGADNETDPEYYNACFNYWAYKGTKQNEMPGIRPDANGKLSLGADDNKVIYDPVLVRRGLSFLVKGIQENPRRLDMRFGRIYMLGQLRDWPAFTTGIVETLDQSAQIENRWLTEGNKAVEQPEKAMLDEIQNYVFMLYETENPDLYPNIQLISETVLKYFPENVASLTNLAVMSIFTEQYDNALGLLHLAEKFAPEDGLVMMNLAHCYKMKGNKEKALFYYEQTKKFGDEANAQFATEQIEALQKQP